jgi:hypothetical protein
MERLGRSVQLLGVTLLLALSACGGSSGGGGGAAAFPFDGSWIGNWSEGPSDDVGTIRIDIDSRGAILGSVFNSTRSLLGTLTGSIRGDGVFNGTIDYPAPNDDINLDGTVGLSKGHLLGEFEERVGPIHVGTGTFDCVLK